MTEQERREIARAERDPSTYRPEAVLKLMREAEIDYLVKVRKKLIQEKMALKPDAELADPYLLGKYFADELVRMSEDDWKKFQQRRDEFQKLPEYERNARVPDRFTVAEKLAELESTLRAVDHMLSIRRVKYDLKLDKDGKWVPDRPRPMDDGHLDPVPILDDPLFWMVALPVGLSSAGIRSMMVYGAGLGFGAGALNPILEAAQGSREWASVSFADSLWSGLDGAKLGFLLGPLGASSKVGAMAFTLMGAAHLGKELADGRWATGAFNGALLMIGPWVYKPVKAGMGKLWSGVLGALKRPGVPSLPAPGPGLNVNLTARQVAKLRAFEKSLPKGHTGVKVDPIGDEVLFTAEVPGRVPGSKAVYQKSVAADGTTTNMIKTTFDRNGNIIHIKDKLHLGPDGKEVIIPDY